MSRFELFPFESDVALANDAASQCVTEIVGSSRARPFCLALSGGRIAQRFFSAFVEEAGKYANDLERVHFFWADERCVPPTDPESNYGIAHRLLFVPLGIPLERIHRIQGELPADRAASLASAELFKIVRVRAEDQPVLDLILLGMGEDGHVASLFPGEDAKIMLDRAVYRPVTAPKPPPKRLTLGYPVIEAARRVAILASGPGKEHAFKAALQFDPNVPLGRVLASRNKTRIFSDLRII